MDAPQRMFFAFSSRNSTENDQHNSERCSRFTLSRSLPPSPCVPLSFRLLLVQVVWCVVVGGEWFCACGGWWVVVRLCGCVGACVRGCAGARVRGCAGARARVWGEEEEGGWWWWWCGECGKVALQCKVHLVYFQLFRGDTTRALASLLS